MSQQPKLAITTAVLVDSGHQQPCAAPPQASDRIYSDLIHRCISSHTLTLTSSDPPSARYEVERRMNKPEDNLGVTGSLQWLYEHTTAPIIAFLHSDTEILEQGWDERVLREFDDPEVGVVGFGGGLQHGSDDIYKVAYRLNQLARYTYLSHTSDAEQHGQRFTGSHDVAVLDGFALIMRREILDRVGGWPVVQLPFHCYDYWACIAAHKLGYKVRLVGVRCHHHGGATSTTPQAQQYWHDSLGKTDQQIHEESHRWIYNFGRGYLPWRCGL